MGLHSGLLIIYISFILLPSIIYILDNIIISSYSSTYFTKIIGIDLEFQAILIAANDHLHKSYINSRYAPTVDEWPPYQPKHYTTLALIHHRDKSTDATIISVTQELAVAGKFQHNDRRFSHHHGSNISQMPNIYSNTTKNISDIFLHLSQPVMELP